MVIPCDIRDIQRTIIVTGQLNSSKVTRNLASKDILHENVIKQKLNPSWPVGAKNIIVSLKLLIIVQLYYIQFGSDDKYLNLLNTSYKPASQCKIIRPET